MKTLFVLYLSGHFSGIVDKFPDHHACLVNRLMPIHSEMDAWSFVKDGMRRTKNGMNIELRCEDSRIVVVQK